MEQPEGHSETQKQQQGETFVYLEVASRLGSEAEG